MRIFPYTRRATATLACGLAAAFAQPAGATNGYISNGYGAEAKAMAGAGVAVDAGVLGLAQNPAMGVTVGNRADACASGFAPERDVTISGAGGLANGKVESDNPFFVIPCLGINRRLDAVSALGLVVYAHGGINTDYDTNVFSPGFGPAPGPLGVDLAQVFVALNYARELAPGLTLGIAPTFAVQRFRARGLGNFAPFSSDPANLTNNGYDWSTGGGVNLGVTWKPATGITLAAAWRSRMYMSKFEDYAGLFAEGGDFDIPATLTIGAAWAPVALPGLTLTAEYQRIFYSDIDSVGRSGVLPPAAFNLGAGNGAGFGWEDMDVFRLAAIWQAAERWTLRTGVSYASEFIDGDEVVFNILAPATPRWHASVGASYAARERWVVTAAYTRAFSASTTGTNPFLTPAQPVRLRMDQHEATLGVSYRW